MYCLPPIISCDISWRLPLADGTALKLCAAFLDAASHPQMEVVLAEDPALLLWAMSQAWAGQQRELTSLREVACWLCEWGTGFEWVPTESTQSADVWQNLFEKTIFLMVPPNRFSPITALQVQSAAWLIAAGEPAFAKEVETVIPPILRNGGEVNSPSTSVVDTQAAANLAKDWSQRTPEAANILALTAANLRKQHQVQSDHDAFLHREKLASLKEFAYGASHELNNPLFNISSRAQMLLREEPDSERRKKLATIYSHALRASEMIKEMALAAHPPRPEFGNCDLVEVANSVIGELAPLAKPQGIFIVPQSARHEVLIEADRVQMNVALRALVLNSIEAMKRALRTGTIRIEISTCVFTSSGEQAVVSVNDEGPGLDARVRRHLFDPFFSGYEAGRGLGFGLSKCWQIVEAHNGQIEVHSEAGQGTSVTLRLPFHRSIVAST